MLIFGDLDRENDCNKQCFVIRDNKIVDYLWSRKF
jgi:hypothetical protein